MSKGKFKNFLNMLAFVSLVLIAFCLLFQLIFKNSNASVINAMRIIGECIAYTLVAFYGFYYVRAKKSPVFAIIYAIALTAIVILIIFR